MFVAINYISCDPSYTNRFEELFKSRAGAVDKMEGFVKMYVLKPEKEGEAYQVVSFWKDDKSFSAWHGSQAFHQGHARGFADMKQASGEGRPAPMKSEMKTYTVLTE